MEATGGADEFDSPVETGIGASESTGSTSSLTFESNAFGSRMFSPNKLSLKMKLSVDSPLLCA
jgi:hypothetical protein